MIFNKFLLILFITSAKITNGYMFYNNTLICANATEKLINSQAVSILKLNSIMTSSVGDCVSRNNSYCTSLEQINCASIRGIIDYKIKSGCQIVITAGTEVGHENEANSHYDGFRLNIDLNKCHDIFIKSNYKFIGRIRNGSPQWEDSCQNIFRLEGNHWNIYFFQY